MNIHCLGISHRTASVALRDSLSFTNQQLNAALALLGSEREEHWSAIQECIILSTCNRVEIYASGEQSVFYALEDFLAKIHGLPPGEISCAAYRLLNHDAISHLFQVAAGLDSVVLGESQILGQVSEAYSAALQHGTTGKVLSRLFQSAIHAGKRARTNTAISQNPSSISSVAVDLIANTIPDLKSARILVIGAGEMAELAVEALRKRGVIHFTVANRTQARAQALADRWNGHSASLELLPDLLVWADAVISSTSAPNIIVSKKMVEAALQRRPDRPLVLMDIAVPRDVDSEVEDIPNVKRFDMDALAAKLEHSLIRRAAEVPAVEKILAEEMAAFLDYLAGLDVAPVIIGIRKQADAIREAELQKTMRQMPTLTPEALQQLDLLTKAIVKKILHHPTIRLWEAAGESGAAEYTDVARSLFGLDEEADFS